MHKISSVVTFKQSRTSEASLGMPLSFLWLLFLGGGIKCNWRSSLFGVCFKTTPRASNPSHDCQEGIHFARQVTGGNGLWAEGFRVCGCFSPGVKT